ncbi:hypothetical protein C6I20_07920 [Aeromicrobium sp. A1-2]|uniref:hypothetical protein n=1 Tax=Aeromicrobium sp. A1-2 TaxID=2107713 RepID=UPI000E4FF976|nr:hypothetical protein [Aeromicrobium sp. A1-2]AXT85114.1 hypothetical protein C6I20_07920 [Aeromicrobium sp. A1-2]
MATVRKVTTPDDARRLAEHLLSSARKLPSVVVTAGSGAAEGLISAEAVADDVGELAEVWWMPTGDATWAFTAVMPDLTQVFGDAARVYSLDESWQTNPYASKLYMCGTQARARQIEEDLVTDAMASAARAGLLTARTAESRIVSGTVRGFPAPGRAMVRGDFGFATIRSELVPGGVSIERLLEIGMVVSGRLDTRDKLLDISPSVREADVALADFAIGDVILARVRTVGRRIVAVEIHPEKVVEIRVGQVTGESSDDLHDLMSVGEVVVARVEHTSPWQLSMLDIAEETVAVACGLIEGGPGWLEPAQAVEQGDELADQADARANAVPPDPPPAVPVMREPEPQVPVAPGPNAHRTTVLNEAYQRERRMVDSLRGEIDQISRTMEALDAEVVRSRRTIEQLKTRQREILKKARRHGADTPTHQAEQFADPEQQLRHEVYLAWVAKIPAGEKAAQPLPVDWQVGPDFYASRAQMPADVQEKVPVVVVEILLGIAERSAGRELHRLRVGMGGEDAVTKRADGAVCWRVAVQRNTPSAARLHFWRCAGSSIELSRVVRHDDMQP